MYGPDLRSVTFVMYDIFFSNSFVEKTLGRLIATVFALDTCDTLESFCPASWDFVKFTSQEECVTLMSSLRKATTNTRGLMLIVTPKSTQIKAGSPLRTHILLS
jgi:hypothetical protein